MAAWLAYLKSRLLLPEEPSDGEPTGEEMAARLTFQLQRLEAMRQRGAEIMSRHRLGLDVFARGEPEGVTVIRHSRYELSLFELLRAYAVQAVRRDAPAMSSSRVRRSIRSRTRSNGFDAMLGSFPDWTHLESFLPKGALNPWSTRSAVASTFAASLEVAKQGLVELRQLKTFGPIFIRPLANETMSDQAQISAIVEAMLFAATEPLDEDDLRRAAAGRHRYPGDSRANCSRFTPRAASIWSRWRSAGLSEPRPIWPFFCAKRCRMCGDCRVRVSRLWRLSPITSRSPAPKSRRFAASRSIRAHSTCSWKRSGCARSAGGKPQAGQ